MTKEDIGKAAEDRVNKSLYGFEANVECDLLLIIDAIFPDKITRDLKRPVGTTIVLARPEKMTNGRGKIIQQDGEFLTLLADTLLMLVEESNGEYSHYSSNPTLAQALKYIASEGMSLTIQQDFSDEAKTASRTKLISRPVLHLGSARETGKMQYYPPKLERPTRMDRAKEVSEAAEEDEKRPESPDSESKDYKLT
ncbi:hypothetical protein AC579_2040 [Pseudocercospora musae]|uniref:Uncharacterized protein n=1 Tax=Pseudocercospora musae TaxID=113226 RepID=A0A139IC39_9PEZI|nr:hypothetical protein AC579_2040 [Pseudocercospora musae]